MSTTLSTNPYLNFFLISLMEIPSNVFFFYSFNRIGRRWSLVLCFLTLGIGLIASGMFKSLEQNNVTSSLELAFFCVAMIGAGGSFGAIFAYTPELYPTNVRNQALGVSSFVSRFGGMIAPFMGLLEEKAVWGPAVLIGCLALFVSALIRFVPETNNKELPQTLDDLKVWFRREITIVEDDIDAKEDILSSMSSRIVVL